MEQEEVDSDTLIEQIYYEYEKSSDGETTRTILLKGDRSLEYRDVRELLDVLIERGISSESRYGEGAVTWAHKWLWKLVHRNQMTPLIDIVLVVLIIMMVNIPIQVNEMGVKLPTKTTQPPPTTQKPQQLVIAIYEDGSTALNRKLISEDNLFFEVTRRLRNMEKKNIFVDAHPAVNYGLVVDMVDMSREAGAVKVGFAKLKESGPAPAVSVDSGALPRGVHPGNPSVVGAMDQVTADKAPAVIAQSAAMLRFSLAQDPDSLDA